MSWLPRYFIIALFLWWQLLAEQLHILLQLKTKCLLSNWWTYFKLKNIPFQKILIVLIHILACSLNNIRIYNYNINPQFLRSALNYLCNPIQRIFDVFFLFNRKINFSTVVIYNCCVLIGINYCLCYTLNIRNYFIFFFRIKNFYHTYFKSIMQKWNYFLWLLFSYDLRSL